MKSDYYFNDLLERENIIIYAMPNHFTHSYVLAMRNGMPMTVVDLLDRIENAISFIRANFDVNQEKYSHAIECLRLAKALFGNKHPKRPKRKCISSFIDVIHEIEDLNANNDIQKQKNEEIAMTMKMLANIFIKD